MSINLNDRATMTELDPHGMLRLTEEFPDQCRKALAIAQQVVQPPLLVEPTFAVLTGLGGSAAGGDFVRAIFENEGSVPFQVNRDYHLPHYVGPRTLVFCASYSGNTEETLSAYDDAVRAGAQVICVTSGGELLARAQRDGFTAYVVPGGQPPRTALGWMMIPVLLACERLGLIPSQSFEVAFDAIADLGRELTVGGSNAAARDLAEELHGKVPIIYGLGLWPTLIANRWRSQINENSKSLAFFNGYPELNHNEILGWVNGNRQHARFTGILLADSDSGMKLNTRASVTASLIGETCEFHRVQAAGGSLLEKLLRLTFFGDFVSIYLARLYKADPENIDSINTLKAELAKV